MIMKTGYDAMKAIQNARTIDPYNVEELNAYNEYLRNPTGRLPMYFTKQGPGVWKMGENKYVQIHAPGDDYEQTMNKMKESNAANAMQPAQ